MKTKTGVFAVLSALFLASGTAGAQMMGGMMGEGHGMMGGSMAEMMGPGFAGACSADLGDLGLSADAQRSLEEKRFELRKKAIRGAADLQVLDLELAHLLENRAFALPTAEKIVGEMSRKEGELRSAHLAFLHDLASMLSDDQWKALQERQKGMMGGQNMMKGGMMKGQMMKDDSGMMMQQGAPGGGGGHGEHHPGSPEEAEKFFDKK